jgi:hypothetical protein
MSQWPSVSFDNALLQQLALELRKRAEAIQVLVSDLSAKRVNDIEESGAGGGLEHQRLDLRFLLWGDPAPRVFITIYDDRAFILRVHNPYLSMDGRLRDCGGRSVATLIEETLRAVPAGAETVRKLWDSFEHVIGDPP